MKPAAVEKKSGPAAGPGKGTGPAFKWQELDAPDFATFVKRLRGINCPEATIRDIVQGELREIYDEKRREVESQMLAAGARGEPAFREQLQQIDGEEMAMLGTLLDAASPVQAVAVVETASSPQAPPAAFGPAGSTLVPAAFLAGNDSRQRGAMGELQVIPTDPKLNAATAAVLQRMREDFAAAVAVGPEASPSTTIYRRRWFSARQDSDEIFSSLFGGDRFIQAQIEAAQN